jgi:8-oxo-dGTP pyrophosphatase MutT (NUDIX family)
MTESTERILAECKKNLERGRAVATGIGVFTVLIKMDEKIEGYPRSLQFLLRRRLEKDSLLGADLSGKWEMTGGGLEIAHLEGSSGPYQVAILAALLQELKEEAGLALATAFPKYSFLIPAWLFNEAKGIIDLAFVMPIPWKWVRETDESKQKFQRGEIRFFHPEELSKIEIVSPRTSFLIKEAIDYASHYWP